MTVCATLRKSHIFADHRVVWRKRSRTFFIRALLTGIILTVVVMQGVISSHAFVKTISQTLIDSANERGFE